MKQENHSSDSNLQDYEDARVIKLGKKKIEKEKKKKMAHLIKTR